MTRTAVDAALSGAPVSPRRLDVDWARGLAVLIMLHAHVLDAWTHPSQRATPAFQYLNIVAGFAAPWFLWLAGLSLMLSGERLLGTGAARRTVTSSLVARGLEIFVLAFAFRLGLFVFNPGGSPLSIFRVDILNIMGPAMAIAGVLWGGVPNATARCVVLAALTAGVAFVTPLVRDAAWVDALPVWLRWYARPMGEHTVFTLFPWAGFVFAGAATGTLLATGRTRAAEQRFHRGAALAGIGLVAAGYYASTLPSIYRHASFWSTSPTFFFIRAGVLLLAGWVLFRLTVPLSLRGLSLAPLTRLGRASLFIYWVHIPIVYGWMTARFRHHLTVWQTLCAFVAFSVAMYAMVPLRDRLAGLWSGPGRRDGAGALVPGR